MGFTSVARFIVLDSDFEKKKRKKKRIGEKKGIALYLVRNKKKHANFQ